MNEFYLELRGRNEGWINKRSRYVVYGGVEEGRG